MITIIQLPTDSMFGQLNYQAFISPGRNFLANPGHWGSQTKTQEIQNACDNKNPGDY